MRDQLVFLWTSEEALDVYLALRDHLTNAGLQLKTSIPAEAPDLGSAPLQQVRSSPSPLLSTPGGQHWEESL